MRHWSDKAYTSITNSDENLLKETNFNGKIFTKLMLWCLKSSDVGKNGTPTREVGSIQKVGRHMYSVALS